MDNYLRGVLLLVNGAPAVGKSALARRYVDDHPLALLVDVDELRTTLGQWARRPESKLIARSLAGVLARAHLDAGYDVVIPQFVGRPEVIAAMAEFDDAFLEVIVTDDAAAVVDRFQARRREFERAGIVHPEAEIATDAVGSEVTRILEQLEDDARARNVPLISGRAGIDAAYAALLAAIESHKTAGTA